MFRKVGLGRCVIVAVVAEVFIGASIARVNTGTPVGAAKRFATAMSWPFDASKVRSRPVPKAHNRAVMVSTNTCTYIVDNQTGQVSVARNYALDQSRRTIARPNKPLKSTDSEWFGFGKTIVQKAWPSVAVDPLDVKRYALTAEDMRSTTARTVRIRYKVKAPAGDQITIIVDSDTGKALTLAYWKKR